MNEAITGLAAVQAELPAIAKSADNPFYSSKYIPLDAIHAVVDPLFEKHGLVWTAFPSHYDGQPVLWYQLHHLESGDVLSAEMPLMLDKQNPQGQGSAITYARRYALTSVLGIVADKDDDGNKASEVVPKEKKPPTFVEQVKATGKTAPQIRLWAAEQGFTLDDVGVDGPGLRKFLENLDKSKQDALLAWAK